MSSYLIIEPKTKEDWDAYYQLRYEVLRKPWNQPAVSTKDEAEEKDPFTFPNEG